MVDTARTLAQLFNIFRDGQSESSISEQDVRDMIVTLVPAIGAIYFSTPVETEIGIAGTPVLALGTTTLLAAAHGISMPQNNRIQYTGDIERHFIIDCAISSTAVSNNETMTYQLYKSGVPLPETLMPRTYGTGSDKGVIAMTTNVHMAKDDYIELFVSNEDSSANITIENGTINLSGFIIE